MRKITKAYLDIAAEKLKTVITSYVGIAAGESDEVYPLIHFDNDDADMGCPPRVSGAGVTLLAFLLQESLVATETQHIGNEKNSDSEWFSKNLQLLSSTSDNRDMAKDYLNFLRIKYPDVYIPAYHVGEAKLGWVDLLLHLDRYYGCWPFSIGRVSLAEGDCNEITNY